MHSTLAILAAFFVATIHEATIAIPCSADAGISSANPSANMDSLPQYSGNMLTLTHWETNYPPELKDFIKAHYYRLANQIPEGRVGTSSDYGPVSTNISHLTAFKGPSNAQWEYQEFMRRFPRAQSR